ncbi:hypothetical protein C8J56DRAFT_890943 [Mycena floridula]|nr:hypothetical protein C8J56DRAFT_890943 [Mycena floridula]
MDEPGDELGFASPSTSPQISSPPARDPTPNPVTRSGQANRLPGRFRDTLPEVAAPVIEEAPKEADTPRRTVLLVVRDSIKTKMNRFKVWRSYLHRPTYDPDSSVPVAELYNTNQHHSNMEENSSEPPSDTNTVPDIPSEAPEPPYPFANTAVIGLETFHPLFLAFLAIRPVFPDYEHGILQPRKKIRLV